MPKPESFDRAVEFAREAALRRDGGESLGMWWALAYVQSFGAPGMDAETPEWRQQRLIGLMRAAFKEGAAFDALVNIARAYQVADVPAPVVLVRWLTAVAGGDIRRPGKGWERSTGRNVRIMLTVAQIACLTGLAPTRNDASDPYSVCDAVAAGYGIGYEGIKSVWKGRRSIKVEGIEQTCDALLNIGRHGR